MKHPGFVLIGLLMTMLGCVGPARTSPMIWIAGPPEQVVEKDYAIGAPKVVSIGGTIIRHKDYWVRKRIQGYVVLDRQVTLATRDLNVVLPHGRVLRAIGAIEIDNMPYWRFVDNQDDQGISPLYYVKPDGALADFLYARGQGDKDQGMKKIINLWHSSVKLPLLYSSEFVRERNSFNYALLFNGKDDRNLYLDYLEFPGDGTVKPSHRQTISIPWAEGRLDLGNLRVQFSQGGPGELTCTVLSD